MLFYDRSCNYASSTYRKSRVERLSTDEAQLSTTKSDGMWDLLGPDWRTPREHVKEALPQVARGPEQDIAAEIRDLLDNEKLSVAEREAFQAFLDCDGDRAAAARRLGLTANAFDQRFTRACHKSREGYRAS
jgi:hypothetical protein